MRSSALFAAHTLAHIMFLAMLQSVCQCSVFASASTVFEGKLVVLMWSVVMYIALLFRSNDSGFALRI